MDILVIFNPNEKVFFDTNQIEGKYNVKLKGPFTISQEFEGFKTFTFLINAQQFSL